MKKILFSSVLLFTFLLGISATASEGITGKWEATMGPGGDMVITFNFKMNGDKLTGTVSTPMGDQEISNGKVDGNSFSFETEMMDSTIKHTGKLDGEVIKLKIEMPEGGPQGPGGPGGPDGITLKRVK
nr:hypothetical protein [uncultured Draconibacterium sp.]